MLSFAPILEECPSQKCIILCMNVIFPECKIAMSATHGNYGVS